jgi:subtilisin family serine protease
MAAPHVSGLAALLLAEESGATPGQIRTVMEQTATSPGSWSQDKGYGTIRALAAYNALNLNPSYASNYGSLTVYVTQGGLPAQGASVLVQKADGATEASNLTDSGGNAHFIYLKSGFTYQVKVRKGSLSGNATGISITPGCNVTVTVTIS